MFESLGVAGPFKGLAVSGSGAWHGGGYGGQNAESSDSRAGCTLNANTAQSSALLQDVGISGVAEAQ